MQYLQQSWRKKKGKNKNLMCINYTTAVFKGTATIITFPKIVTVVEE